MFRLSALLFGLTVVCGVGLPSLLSAQSAPPVYLGIDVLEERGFDVLRGKRVGLLTNPAGVNRHGETTLSVFLRAPEVNLVALFGPEHGIYGDEAANVPIEDRVDPRTGLPIYSLYGRFRKPTPNMLRNLDVFVVDLQDLGVRSYTYVSAMRLAIEACFEHGVEVVVLDRPNPMGGLKVDGPPLEEVWMSYVGAYRVPYVHGLTIGELARMAHGTPGWLQIPADVARRGRLTVVPMRGWERSMLWPQTGLRWVRTSPAIPTVEAAIGYSMTGLGAQLGGFRHGIGTPHPFRLLTFAGRSDAEVAAALNARNIPGMAFRPVNFRDQNGVSRSGVYTFITDWEQFRPTLLSFHMMTLAAAWQPTNPFATATTAQADLFNKHVGSTAWWEELKTRGAQARIDRFFAEWTRQAEAFQRQSRRFWLY
jgi:uncharacterized protein YbbC (DUF1343 family)